jgi:hypothetical protein
MSDAYYTIKLADGRTLTGPIQGNGGTIPAGQEARIQIQIDRANAGEALGIYEPKPGHACMRWYEHGTPGPEMPREHVDLRGATLVIGDAWTCHARPAALGRTCGHVNAHGGAAYGCGDRRMVCCESCGCTKSASDDRAARATSDKPHRKTVKRGAAL